MRTAAMRAPSIHANGTAGGTREPSFPHAGPTRIPVFRRSVYLRMRVEASGPSMRAARAEQAPGFREQSCGRRSGQWRRNPRQAGGAGNSRRCPYACRHGSPVRRRLPRQNEESPSLTGFHIPQLLFGDPCYLRGVHRDSLRDAHAICMVPAPTMPFQAAVEGLRASRRAERGMRLRWGGCSLPWRPWGPCPVRTRRAGFQRGF